MTLIVLISYGAVGAVLFTPAIPRLMDLFSISSGTAQLSVTSYLVGYCLGQLIYSPLAKRYGRRPALYVGISISLLGYLLCALSAPLHAFSLLVYSRLIAGLGSSVGLTLTFMIISDYFYEREARKVLAYTMIAFAVIPGVPSFGELLVAHLGWESCFYFLSLYALFTLFLVFRLAETSSGKEREAIPFKKIIRDYKRDFSSPMLLLYSLMIGATTAIVYIFATTAPLISIRMMGLTPATFGLYNLIPSLGYLLGNFTAARLANHFEIKTVLKQGIVLIGMGILILALTSFGREANPLGLFLPLSVICFGIPLFYSNAATLATFRSRDKLNASSILSFINVGVAFVGVVFIGVLQGNPMNTMPSLFIGIFLLMIVLFTISQKLGRE